MGAYLSTNRYLAALQLAVRNPLSSARFVRDRRKGVQALHHFKIGDIGLWLRTQSPDLKVVRACLLGEFDEALDLSKPDSRFIVDAGGFIGLVSILFAKRFPDARVICLEPSSENFEIARRNCEPWPNITVLNCALGSSSGHATLRDRGTGQWGFTITDTVEQGGVRDIEDVEVVSLPDLMAAYGAERVDLLKLDIEGAEYDIFQTSEDWIGACQVMIVELHEKIRPGVTELYQKITHGRREVSRDAEKRLSVLSAGGA
jgi:FkbM family methyltransferase